MSRQSFQNREYMLVFLGLNSTYKQKSYVMHFKTTFHVPEFKILPISRKYG
jgi:hypothetical protein